MSGKNGRTITKVTAGGLVLVTMGLGSFLVVDKVVNKSDSTSTTSSYASSPMTNAASGSPSSSSHTQATSSSDEPQPSESVAASQSQTQASSQAQQPAPAQPAAPPASHETTREAAPPASDPVPSSPSSSAAQPLPMPSNVNSQCHTGNTANANATLSVDYARVGNGSNVSDCDFVIGVADEVRSRAASDHGLTSLTFSQYNAFRAGRIAKDGQVVTGSAATAKGVANKSNPDVEMACTRYQGLTQCNDTYGIGVKIWVQDDYL